MQEANDQLKGSWAENFASWSEGLTDVARQWDATPLKVLALGPGPHRPEYAKRKELCDDMGGVPATDVITPEEVMASPEGIALKQRGLDEIEITEVCSTQADAIVVLVVKSDDVTGVHGEMMHFSRDPRFASKIRLLRPRGEGSQALIQRRTQAFPVAQTLEYSNRQYSRCHDIRAKCRQWIDEVRKDKFLQAFRGQAR